MAKKRIKTIAGVAAAVGASAAFLWLRDFISFARSGGAEEQRQDYLRRRMTQVRMNNAQPQPIPASGAAAPAPAGTATGPSPVLDDLSVILVQYLLSFHSQIELLRSRRKESTTPTTGSSLTQKDRESFRQTLELLEEPYAGYDPANLQTGSVQQRVYNLMRKIHDTMHNPNLSDDDLFRIFGEVSTQACQVLDEVRDAGSTSGSDFRYARTLYECE